MNLNTGATDFPAADLGDDALGIAIQITNHDKSGKIKDAREKAVAHRLGERFDRLIIFFLLAKKPGMPGDCEHPADGPRIETWDLADLLKQMMSLDMNALVSAREVLEKEMPSRELQYGPRHTPPQAGSILVYEEEFRATLAHDIVELVEFVTMGGWDLSSPDSQKLASRVRLKAARLLRRRDHIAASLGNCGKIYYDRGASVEIRDFISMS